MPGLITLQSILEGLPSWGARPALGLRATFGTRWWSYAELYRNSLYAAYLFQQQDLRPGERIVIYGRNCPEWIACLLGAAWRALVLVPVDAGMHPAEVERLTEEIGAVLVVTFPSQNSDGIRHRLLRFITLGAPVELELDAEPLRQPLEPDGPAVIIFTSGVGGRPRGVVLTHRNLTCQLPRFQYWRPVLRIVPARLLALSPLSHVQGFMLSACVPLTLGLTVLYTHSVEPHHLQRTLRAARVRVLSTVPRILQMLQSSMLAMPGARPSWALRRRALGPLFRAVLTGGATLPESCESFWRRCGCILVQGYGSTETAAIVTINPPLLGRDGSIGRGIHRDSLRIAPDGELLVRGPHLSPGYADATLPLTPDGFLPTGDFVRRDSRNRLYFIGRKSERLVTAEGYNIDPNVIETALRRHPEVVDAVAFAISPGGFDELHATILLRTTDAAVAGAAVQRANAALSPWERVRSWTIWPEADFPRAKLEKVDRAAVIAGTGVLLDLALKENDQPRPALVPATLDEILADPDSRFRVQRLADFLRESSPNSSAGERIRQVRELGLDSIQAAELITLLEKASSAGPADQMRQPSAGTLPGEYEPSGAVRRAPRWQITLAGSLLRAVFRPLLRSLILPIFVKVRVTGRRHLESLTGPVVFAIQRPDRQHPVEFLAIFRALPSPLARRLLFVIAEKPFFETRYYRKPGDTALFRFFVACVALLGLPAIAPYVLLETGTVRGLEETCTWMDRGFHPLVTWSAAPARITVETGATVVPIHLYGNWSSWWNARIHVRFGLPQATLPFAQEEYTHLHIRAVLHNGSNEPALV
jgi:long-chain acyl-CoA synthetase